MLARDPDRTTLKKVEILQEYAKREPTRKSRLLTVRFLVSPVELIGDESGQLVNARLVKNELYATEAGTLRPRATDQFEDLPVGLLFRSVGYRGVPLPGVPFHDKWGVILNQKGRVIDPDSQQPVVGEYTAGWIKRGPSGVIGTNKPDAAETVECMIEDLAEARMLNPAQPEIEAIARLVQERQPNYFSYDDWLQLDAIEVERGKALGRPRLKFTRVEDMIAAVQKVKG
jgi:ferredoxin--NADP+ reductase